MTDPIPILSSRDLCVTYPGGIRALTGVSVEIRRGEFVALIGPNGSGKSTLLRCLAGLMTPTSGDAQLEGIAAHVLKPLERARRVAYVQQSHHPAENLSALDFTLLGRYAHLDGWRIFSPHDQRVALEALERVGALEFKDRALGELSGGERQRVVLARALAQEAPVLLLDEPTGALDARHQIRLCELIFSLREKEGKTVVAATHDLNLASQFADRLYFMNAGAVAAQGTPDETLTEKLLASIYGIDVAHGYFSETIDGRPRPWVLPRARRK